MRNWKLLSSSFVTLILAAVVVARPFRTAHAGPPRQGGATGMSTAHAQAAPSAPSGVGVIDESSLVRLEGNRHSLANASNDRGKAAPDLPMERMLLVLKRAPQTESALQQLLAEQQNKSSPRFHAWLSPEEFAARFALAPADRQKVAAWLQSHGLRVDRISRGGMVIEFHGTAAQVEQAFHTSIHRYQANGENHYANAADPQIPAALAPVVAGVDTLHNFLKQPPVHVLGSASRIANTSTWQPNFTFNGLGGVFHFLAPGDFATIYNAAALYQSGIDGTGQSIAIVGRSNINLSDIQIFRIAFGLPVNDPAVILDGPDPGNFFGLEETEADLDIEWSGAIAPKATIKFVASASTNTTDGVDLSALYIVDNNIAPVMSTSFGECEASLGSAQNIFFSNLWAQAAAEGITAIVASGDSGAAGCDNPVGSPATGGLAVNGLASTPFNVAVGGTQLNENGNNSLYWSPTNGPNQASALAYIPENVWNESCSDPNQCAFGVVNLFASGGGPSSIYSKPSWQAGPGVPNDGLRDLPDVSLAAAAGHDGYLLCQNGICLTDANGQLIEAFVVGGTSAAAPTFAAMMALVNQKTNSRQGQANFVLYPLAANQNAANCNASQGPQSTCVFNDVTQGNNDVPGQTGFPAGAGYDLATGLGSLNAFNLVQNWSNVTFVPTTTALQLSPATITHGQPVNVSVTVTPTAGGGTPTGNVALLTGGPQNVNLGSLTNGSISAPVTTLPGGNYSLTAGYSGDGAFGSSLSNSVPLRVSAEPSNTTFSTLPSSSITFSDFLFLQVAVAGASGQGIATGTISFSDTFNGNTTALMTLPLNSEGNLSVPETTLAIGTHSVTANYSGDPSFTPSSAGPVTVTVTKGVTQTSLFIPSGAAPNTPVLLFAFVLPLGAAEPTGNVQFFDGSAALGNPVAIKNFVAIFTATQLATGQHSITAAYPGDANFNGSTSPASILTIGNPDFQIGVNPGNVSVSRSSSGKTNVLLSPGPGLGFQGTVSFSCSGLPSGTSCNFQPQPVTLDGFTPASVQLSISEGAAQAPSRQAWKRPLQMLPLGFAGLILGAAFLSIWPRRILRRRLWALGALAAFVLALSLSFGCGGGSSSSSSQQSPPPPVGSSSIVTVTASGSSNTGTVTHSVSLSVTFQ